MSMRGIKRRPVSAVKTRACVTTCKQLLIRNDQVTPDRSEHAYSQALEIFVFLA